MLVHNFDLGDYSFVLGSAQRLSNGNYHFLSGFLVGPMGPANQSIELLPNGQRNFVYTSTGGVYRSFRMQDMYTP